jgi:hypothetical protein
VLHALGAHRPEIGYAQGMCHGKIWEKYVKVGKCLIVFNCQDFLSLPCQEDAAWRFMFNGRLPGYLYCNSESPRCTVLRNQLAAVFLKLGFEEEAAFSMMDAIMKAEPPAGEGM